MKIVICEHAPGSITPLIQRCDEIDPAYAYARKNIGVEKGR